MNQPTQAAPPPAPAPYPTTELISAVADILRFIDKKRRATAVFADDTPRPDRSPAPPVKEPPTIY